MLLHPDEITLMSWADGELTAVEPALINHITTCQICQERLATLAAEAADWQAALSLAPAERRFLAEARLPQQLRVTAQAEQRRNYWHLLILLAACLTIAASWLVLESTATPLINQLDRLANLPTLVVSAGVTAFIWLLTALAPLLLLPDLPGGRLILSLALITLIIRLWRWRGPLPTATGSR